MKPEHQQEIMQVAQARSNFMLDNFVIGKHETPARQRLQCLEELHTLYARKEDLEDSAQDILDGIKEQYGAEVVKLTTVSRLKRQAENVALTLAGIDREIAHLEEWLSKSSPLTREVIESEERDYWAGVVASQIATGTSQQ